MSNRDKPSDRNSEKKNSNGPYVLPPVDRRIQHIAHSRTSLVSLEGIGNVRLNRLREIGIRTLNSFLQRTRTPKGRQEIAEHVKTSEKQVLKWTGRADKIRVRGIGPEYAALLESAGVDTVPELARRNPENLHSKILEVNASKNIVSKPPAKKQVEQWVSEAKQLPRMVEY